MLVVLRRAASGERELEVLGDELFDVWAADVVTLLDLDDLEDLWIAMISDGRSFGGNIKSYVNRPEPSTMPRRHILVHGLHSIAARHLAVLLVHVVCAGAGVVANPDTEVLDLLWLLLVNLYRLHISISVVHHFTAACSPAAHVWAYAPCSSLRSRRWPS